MFICKECDYITPKWMGQCLNCNMWNTLVEQAPIKKRGQTIQGLSSSVSSPLEATPMSTIIPTHTSRTSTGSAEFDRVLGGGLLPGSVVLLGGEPGIGKSTLLLQTSSYIASQTQDETESSVLYVCTEESQDQVAQRASRLGIHNSNILLSQEYHIDKIDQLVQKYKPKCIIVDSIQALRAADMGYAAGQGAHIRHCADICCQWSQQYNTIVFIVAHITKEGIIAGPKLIEHMVDTVLMFEKTKYHLRFLYAQKNRHGAVDEVGIVHMTHKGIQDIADVGSFFLGTRNTTVPPGICVAATFEGTRPFLVEIQSLTVSTLSNNRVFSDRVDSRKISRISAVLEKHIKLPLSNQNIYVNVAGGIRISEPGLELALALSLYSAYKDISLPSKTCAIGELSLPGEVLSVDNFSQRCRQAVEYGFTHIIAPIRDVQALNTKFDIEIIGVHNIEEAIQKITSL